MPPSPTCPQGLCCPLLGLLVREDLTQCSHSSSVSKWNLQPNLSRREKAMVSPDVPKPLYQGQVLIPQFSHLLWALWTWKKTFSEILMWGFRAAPQPSVCDSVLVPVKTTSSQMKIHISDPNDVSGPKAHTSVGTRINTECFHRLCPN